MDLEIDLAADLNAEDDDGLGWTVLSDARDPSRVRPGAMLVAGNGQCKAVVLVVSVDDDGQVHFTVLPGSRAGGRMALAPAEPISDAHWQMWVPAACRGRTVGGRC
jgi:hypothetical protein